MQKIIFNGHTLTLHQEGTPFHAENTVTCETCSVPAVIAAAVIFMVKHNVRKMTVDGADLFR